MTAMLIDVGAEAGYAWGEPVLRFDVLGDPVGQGRLSPKGRDKNGRVILVHSNEKALKGWRNLVAEMARQEIDRLAGCGVTRASFPLQTAVAVEVVFTMPIPYSALREGRPYPTVKSQTNSDVDHLERAIYDGLTGVVFEDDALVVDARHPKTYPAGTTPYAHPRALGQPGVSIAVYALPIPPEKE